MMLRRALPLSLLLAACGGDSDVGATSAVSMLGAPANEQLTMPVVPGPVASRLRVIAVGRDSMMRDWRASADWCSSVAALRIVADDTTSGAMIILRPATDSLSGTYPIVLPDSAASRPAAHIGVLLSPARRGFIFQGIGGSVDARADGSRISGELRVDLSEVGTELQMKFAGSFDRLRVVERSDSVCAELGLAAQAEPTDPIR